MAYQKAHPAIPQWDFRPPLTRGLRPAPDAPAKLAPYLATFLDLSVVLTGFDEVTLRGAGVADSYLRAAESRIGAESVEALLLAYGAIAKATVGDPAAREARVRRDILGDERLGPIARAILKLWYYGTWYALPEAWHQKYGPAPDDTTYVVSAAGYVEGLLWRAIGAHPAGAKAPGFGSWAYPPVFPDP
jgi:hypothetical protein